MLHHRLGSRSCAGRKNGPSYLLYTGNPATASVWVSDLMFFDTVMNKISAVEIEPTTVAGGQEAQTIQTGTSHESWQHKNTLLRWNNTQPENLKDPASAASFLMDFSCVSLEQVLKIPHFGFIESSQWFDSPPHTDNIFWLTISVCKQDLQRKRQSF